MAKMGNWWMKIQAEPRREVSELENLTLFPRRDSGRDGDMRMVALRRSVHRGEW